MTRIPERFNGIRLDLGCQELIVDIVCMYVYYYGMKRINFFIDDEMLNDLREISDNTGIPVSGLIRQAIQQCLDSVGENGATDKG